MSDTFKALVLDEADGRLTREIRTLRDEDLPPGEVLVEVSHSSLNYKDGLAITGKGKIVRRFPMVPGIDLAGVVAASESPQWKPGDRVILNGWGVGERHWGGFAGKARVKAQWLTPLPEAIQAAQAMAVGTAGYTAMLAVLALEERGVAPGAGPIVVTGAGGGVGGMAICILAQLGYEVVAVTGRAELRDYLEGLGATRILERAALARAPKPLESETWAGAVDSVGGHTLATVLAQARYGATVAACGLAGGAELPTTVFPFILRAVALQGIDSVMLSQPRRRIAWERIARDLPMQKVAEMTETVPLEAVAERAEALIAGRIRGRVVVDLGA